MFVCRANGGRSAISRVLTEHYAQGCDIAAAPLEALGLDSSREVPADVDARVRDLVVELVPDITLSPSVLDGT